MRLRRVAAFCVDLLFTSSRCDVCVPCWSSDVMNIYRCRADGKFFRRLTFDHAHNVKPSVLNDGCVVFTRWEYNDRNSATGEVRTFVNEVLDALQRGDIRPELAPVFRLAVAPFDAADGYGISPSSIVCLRIRSRALKCGSHTVLRRAGQLEARRHRSPTSDSHPNGRHPFLGLRQ